MYALLAGIILAGALAGGVWYYGEKQYTRGSDACVAEYDEANAKLLAEGKEAERVAAKRLEDMAATYRTRQAKAVEAARTAQTKGAVDVASEPVFQRQECALPAGSVTNLNQARGNVRTAE